MNTCTFLVGIVYCAELPTVTPAVDFHRTSLISITRVQLVRHAITLPHSRQLSCGRRDDIQTSPGFLLKGTGVPEWAISERARVEKEET